MPYPSSDDADTRRVVLCLVSSAACSCSPPASDRGRKSCDYLNSYGLPHDGCMYWCSKSGAKHVKRPCSYHNACLAKIREIKSENVLVSLSFLLIYFYIPTSLLPWNPDVVRCYPYEGSTFVFCSSLVFARLGKQMA